MVKRLSETVFKACFHYLTSFDNLEDFSGGSRQMKQSVDMTFL